MQIAQSSRTFHKSALRNIKKNNRISYWNKYYVNWNQNRNFLKKYHKGQDVSNRVWFQNLISRSWTDTSISQCGCNNRHAFAVHLHGTTLKKSKWKWNFVKLIPHSDKSNLEIKIKTFTEIDFLGEAFIFTHVEGQCIVAICVLPFW